MIFTLVSDTHFGYNHKTVNHHKKMLRKIRQEMQRVGSKVLVHAGDWAAFRQKHFRIALEMFRNELPDIEIVCVRGNHEFWEDHEVTSWDELFLNHQLWFEAYRVHHLEIGPFIYEDVAFIGFDGWYEKQFNTNDHNWMLPHESGSSFDFLSRKAFSDLISCLDIDTTKYRKTVGVTHMPLFEGSHNGNPRWYEPFASKCDVLCFGHEHKKRLEGEAFNGLPAKCYMAGSDYGNFKFMTIEI